MSFENLNPYILIAVAGFFSGIGNIVGQWLWKTFLERHATRHAKRIKKILRVMKH